MTHRNSPRKRDRTGSGDTARRPDVKAPGALSAPDLASDCAGLDEYQEGLTF